MGTRYKWEQGFTKAEIGLIMMSEYHSSCVNRGLDTLEDVIGSETHRLRLIVDKMSSKLMDDELQIESLKKKLHKQNRQIQALKVIKTRFEMYMADKEKEDGD